MSPVTEHLCAIIGCIDAGQHQAQCTNTQCRGCQPRMAERPNVCQPHRHQMPGDLDQIEALWARLVDREDHTDTTEWTVRQIQRLPIPTTSPIRLAPWANGSWIDAPGGDPLLTVMPAGPVGRTNQRRVSGSRHAPVPANLTRLDLAAAARQGSRAPHTRGVLGLDPDQIGDLSVATELETWARDWRESLFPDQRLPTPTVPPLVDWLKIRVDEACTHHLGIDEFAADIAKLRSAMVGELRLNPARKELCRGVACRSCDRKALYRDGAQVQCGWCQQYYSEREYNEWVSLLADGFH